MVFWYGSGLNKRETTGSPEKHCIVFNLILDVPRTYNWLVHFWLVVVLRSSRASSLPPCDWRNVTPPGWLA